ncbi:MAG: hypothetical protein WBF70_01680 [Aeromonas molluscorum]|uniref:hypothetical protein n=1 Tax=Aeromonas molluscorum TaxID=271417 RepID=UPI003CB8DA51
MLILKLSRREAAPLLCLGCGLLLMGVSEQARLLLAGLSVYLVGGLVWYQLSQPRNDGKRKQAWPLWLYESRPFVMILLGLLMLREATHPLFLLPALFWVLLGGHQLWLRHQHRFWRRRAPALRPL